VFLTFQNGEAIQKRISEVVATTEPYFNVVTADDMGHALWLCSVEDSVFFKAEFEQIPCMYIADGHHRAASAFNVGKQRREKELAEGKVVTG
jgi:uncharacterized protein (DUF1015 family)